MTRSTTGPRITLDLATTRINQHLPHTDIITNWETCLLSPVLQQKKPVLALLSAEHEKKLPVVHYMYTICTPSVGHVSGNPSLQVIYTSALSLYCTPSSTHISSDKPRFVCVTRLQYILWDTFQRLHVTGGGNT